MEKDKKCGHNVKCGCKDTSLSTQKDPCIEEELCVSAECEEVICQHCVSNCLHDMQYLVGGYNIEFKKGERADVSFQKILVALSAPPCIQSVAYGVKALNITKDSMYITWEGNDSYEYKVVTLDQDDIQKEYSLQQGLYQIKLEGLLRNMTYKIKVVSINNGCESVTISVKTKDI